MKLRLKLLIIFLCLSVLPTVLVWQAISRENPNIFTGIFSIGFPILCCGVVLLVIWVYNAILRPIEKLERATKLIKAGELDFVLEPDSTDEIGQLTQNFEDMRVILKHNQLEKLETDRDNKELLSNISHDLKTPITAIKGYALGIMDGVASSPEKMNQYIKTIYNKANDMDKLIDELTFYSKIDTNRIPYNFNTIRVVDFFDDCASEVELDIQSRDMEFSYKNNVPEDIKIIADSEQLKRVINNIISNSIKYMNKKPGHISLVLSMDGDFVKTEITDNGRGISQSELPYVFDRFYRADGSRNRSTGGSGIGLSIVKKIVEDHGGKVWAKSKQDEWTQVVIILRKYTEANEDEQDTDS